MSIAPTLKRTTTSIMLFAVAAVCCAQKQSSKSDFAIRTITAGITVRNLDDTTALLGAIHFLNDTKSKFENAGYTVQTIRIATQNFYEYQGTTSREKSIDHLIRFDRMARRYNVALSIWPTCKPECV